MITDSKDYLRTIIHHDPIKPYSKHCTERNFITNLDGKLKVGGKVGGILTSHQTIKTYDRGVTNGRP